MSYRKITFASGEFYHLYNRGNSKQAIFHDDEDRIRFLYLLFLSNDSNRFNIFDLKKNKDVFDHDREDQLVSIGAYTLMNNHFHILVTQGQEGGISKFMQKLTTGYSMYYNKKYKRTGGLFEGKFKARHAVDDRYLKYLFSYIHLNAVQLLFPLWKENGIHDVVGAFRFISKYEWCSYIDCVSEKIRPFSAILDKNAFPDYFSSKKIGEKEILDWLKYKDSLS